MKRNFSLAMALALSLPASIANSAEINSSIDFGPQAEVNTVDYQCKDGSSYIVRYINAGPNSLALIEVEGSKLLFVNVISGSGARYVSGTYEWWTKGDDATLNNIQQDNKSVECTVPKT